MKDIKDSSIYKFNPCVMSGGITYIIISQGKDTTKITLDNTIDLTSIEIIKIINPYLPKGKKLYWSKDMIAEEKFCWKYPGLAPDMLK